MHGLRREDLPALPHVILFVQVVHVLLGGYGIAEDGPEIASDGDQIGG